MSFREIRPYKLRGFVMAKVCRFCLKSGHSEEQFVEIDTLLKDLLDALLLNLDFNLSKRSAICKECLNQIYEMFDFKTICLYTEDAIHPFINKEGQVKLNLLTLHSKAKLPSSLNSKEVQICRLCLEITKECVPLETEMLQYEFYNFLKNHLPEISLDATNDPQICENCRKQLYRFQDFVSVCTNTEDKIMKIFKGEVEPGQLVDSFKSYSELPFMIKDEVDFKREPKILESYEESCEFLTSNKVYKCSKCVYETTVRQYIKKHLFTHSPHDQGPYRCPKKNCCWTTRFTHNLKKHIKAHSTVIMCRLCEDRFEGKYEYVRHTKSQHREGKHWKCPRCKTISNSRTGLLIHMKIHKGINLQCCKCNFQTKYAANLVEHNRVIHENGPCRIKKQSSSIYYCHDCSFKTKTKHCIRNHVLTHKSKADMPLIECGECNFTTKSKTSLYKHKQSHLNIVYKCLVCDAMYSSQSGLEKHKRLHNKEKLKCPECDYENMDKYRLDAHLKKHRKITSDQKVHKCKLCSFQSLLKSCVSKHLNQVHKKHNN